MTPNINNSKPSKTLSQKIRIKEVASKVINVQWKLKSIYETGLISDEAKYKAVELVFSPFHIYVLHGNRTEKYRYSFTSPKTFKVDIEGNTAKCIIKKLNSQFFVFHADFNGHYFIIEMEK